MSYSAADFEERADKSVPTLGSDLAKLRRLPGLIGNRLARRTLALQPLL